MSLDLTEVQLRHCQTMLRAQREEIEKQRALLLDIHARIIERLKHSRPQSKSHSLMQDIRKLIDAHFHPGGA